MFAMYGAAASSPSAPAAQPAVRPDTVTNARVRLAPQYRVLIHNDDVTTMDFVVKVLLDVFRKEPEEAFRIMLEAHHAGVALVVVLPFEQAELRIEQAHSLARTAKFPLTFSMEPAE